MLKGVQEINVQDTKNHNTFLHEAVLAKNNTLIKTLLKEGADPHITDALGRTPADLAKEQGDIETAIQILILSGTG